MQRDLEGAEEEDFRPPAGAAGRRISAIIILEKRIRKTEIKRIKALGGANNKPGDLLVPEAALAVRLNHEADSLIMGVNPRVGAPTRNLKAAGSAERLNLTEAALAWRLAAASAEHLNLKEVALAWRLAAASAERLNPKEGASVEHLNPKEGASAAHLNPGEEALAALRKIPTLIMAVHLNHRSARLVRRQRV